MIILGIETSCDETGVALVENGKTILTDVVASSAQMHIKYGGVVPEVAARRQVETIVPVLTEAMQGFTKYDIEAIAVTVGPGLIGSLLVGVETAKTLAFTWKKPLIPVNHVLAHMYAAFLQETSDKKQATSNAFYSSSDPSPNGKGESRSFLNKSGSRLRSNYKIEFPAISLVVSGGHTELYLMKDEKTLKWLGGTLDDAAGECFDKTARLLGLPYPGGPEIAALAAKLRTKNYELRTKLPRPMMDESLNFSFSGLKTAVLREWNRHTDDSQPTTYNLQLVSAFAYEIQEAITDVLVTKTLRAAEIHNVRSIIVSGGVAANKRLKEKFKVQSSKFKVFVPHAQLCVDSATYIAAYAYYHNQPQDWKDITALPGLSVENE